MGFCVASTRNGSASGHPSACAAAFNARNHARTDSNIDVTALVRHEPSRSSLIEAGYVPTVLEVGGQPLVWLAGQIRWLHTDDHPADDLAAARFRVSMPASIEGFVRVRANDLDGARKLLDGNPNYEGGGTVEIRTRVHHHRAEPGSLAWWHREVAERFGGSQVRHAMAGADGLCIAKEIGGDSVDLLGLFAIHGQAIYDTALRMLEENENR